MKIGIMVVLMLTFISTVAFAEVDCRVNTGAVVAHIIHDGNNVEFNKTQRVWNIKAISFIPQNVADRLSQITKMEWDGGVLASLKNKDGSLGYIYVQRKDLACP